MAAFSDLSIERERLAETISEFPCGRCDPEHKHEDCSEYGRGCWSLYKQEAVAVQDRFLIPLRLAYKRMRGFSIALALSCLCLLVFPPHPSHHHILESLVQTIVSDARAVVPKVERSIQNALALHRMRESMNDPMPARSGDAPHLTATASYDK